MLPNVWFEPTDVKKATKAFKKDWIIDFVSPNLNELKAIVKGSLGHRNEGKNKSAGSILEEALELSHHLMERVNTAFVTLGKLGVMVSRRGSAKESLFNSCNESSISTRLYPPPIVSNFKSVSGAGDCFAAAVIAGMLQGFTESECMNAASTAAALSIAAPMTVPPTIRGEDIPWNVEAKYTNLRQPLSSQ